MKENADQKRQAEKNKFDRDILAQGFAKILLQRLDDTVILTRDSGDTTKSIIVRNSYDLAQRMLEQSALHYESDMEVVNAKEGENY